MRFLYFLQILFDFSIDPKATQICSCTGRISDFSMYLSNGRQFYIEAEITQLIIEKKIKVYMFTKFSSNNYDFEVGNSN